MKNYLNADANAKEEIEREYKAVIDHYLEPAFVQAKEALSLNPNYSTAILQLAFVHYSLSFADSEQKLYHASKATEYFTKLCKSAHTTTNSKFFDMVGHYRDIFNLIPLFRARMYALQGEEYFEKGCDLAFSYLSNLRNDSSISDNTVRANFNYTIAMLNGLKGEHETAYELFQKSNCAESRCRESPVARCSYA